MSVGSVDFETSSLADLNARGIYHYASDPSTKVLMLGYAFDDEPPEIWLPGQPFPERLAAHIREGGVLRAWNASFERLIWEYVLANDHPDIPVPRLEQWECTAARARAHGLPHSLDNCAKALEMPIAKSPEGKRLIDTYCVKGVQIMDIPEVDRELFIEYCKQDVEVERMIGKVLRELDDDEWQDYLINEIINDRGLPIDTEFALAAQHYGEQVKRDANAKIRALTGGMVEKATSRKMRTVWLRERLTEEEFEIIESSFDEHHRAELAALPGLHPDVKRFIELVEDAGGATMAKYANIFNRTIDNRLNGAFLFSGAGQTGRYSSLGVQVHNLTREVFEEPEPMIASIKAHEPIDDPAEALRRLVRNTIYAPNGMSWGDFSNIEGRVAPWLEGTDLGRAKLEMFARGVDPYIANAAQMYRIPYEDVTPQQRQGGKTAELACGFLGGTGAIISMAKNFKLSFTEDEAKALRDAWRNVNPWAKSFGAHLDAAVLRAVRMPGQWHEAGRVSYAYGGDWLWCRLPSGRMLAYAKPRLEVVPTPWGDERAAVTVLWGARKPKRGKPWPRRALHAGLLLENITQATAACVLRFAIRQAHFMGLRVIGHVHDEIIVEGLVEDALRAAMTGLPGWTDGLDIPVKINDGQRYGK